MFSLDLKGILRCIYSSDEGGLLIGHTDVLSRTEEHGGQIEVSYFMPYLFYSAYQTCFSRSKNLFQTGIYQRFCIMVYSKIEG